MLRSVGDNLKFASVFYDAYFAARPRRPGFELREKLVRLAHPRRRRRTHARDAQYTLFYALHYHNFYGSAYGHDFVGQVRALGDEVVSAC